MIRDLFSHKIHSSDDDWPDKLVELAAVFEEFDGEIYDRAAIEDRLRSISPRAAFAPRDASKFRDEISAYPAYLGLYHMHPSPEGWRVRLSRSAREFLIREEPDVGSFMRMQLALFQYPNGMGAAYKSRTNNLRIQANARDRMLQIILNAIHVSPLRLIIVGMMADAKLREVSGLEGVLSYEEVFVLANDPRTNRTALPDETATMEVLKDYRRGGKDRPTSFERRFHILKHTDLFEIGSGKISFRTPVNDIDKEDILSKLNSIRMLKKQFNDLDEAVSGEDIERIIASGSWSNYFDGLANLKGETISILKRDIVDEVGIITERARVPIHIETIPTTYSLTDRREYSIPSTGLGRRTELADPEMTRIKRQKRNLAHKLLIDKMCDCLLTKGAKPKDNPHIDLYAEIPNDGAFLFEMKSGGENLLDQIRKGISQLYEYRFRYRDGIRNDTVLCLVIPENPCEVKWLCEYICKDRGIALCWFSEDDTLQYPEECSETMRAMIES